MRFGYRAWVEDFAVDPESALARRREGLLDAAKDWARERGATHLELDSAQERQDAHRFYEREGAEYKSRALAGPLGPADPRGNDRRGARACRLRPLPVEVEPIGGLLPRMP